MLPALKRWCWQSALTVIHVCPCEDVQQTLSGLPQSLRCYTGVTPKDSKSKTM